MKVTCSCGKQLQVPENLRGKRGRCPGCGDILEIPLEEVQPLTVQPVAASTSYSAEELFEYVIPSVVGVVSSNGAGSGVLIDANGIGATNRHVVGIDQQVKIRMNDGAEHEASLLRSYRDIDLAFFKISFLSDNRYVEMPPPGGLRVGESVFAIGHPFGFENTLTRGIISATAREVSGTEYVQTDAPINPGNSGGPLFNEYARVVGINTWGVSESQGLNFAIPATIIQERYEAIKRDLKAICDSTYCGVCGKNSVDAQYCENCGVKFETAPSATWLNVLGRLDQSNQLQQCPKCSGPVEPGNKFCPSCGEQLH